MANESLQLSLENLPAIHSDPFDRILVAQENWEPPKAVSCG